MSIVPESNEPRPEQFTLIEGESAPDDFSPDDVTAMEGALDQCEETDDDDDVESWVPAVYEPPPAVLCSCGCVVSEVGAIASHADPGDCAHRCHEPWRMVNGRRS